MKLCLNLPDAAAIFGRWLFDWQTLISGVLALIAAAATIYFLKVQISLAERQSQQLLKRQHQAARVVLPIVLSTISGYCQRSADEIASKIEQVDPFAAPGILVPNPTLTSGLTMPDVPHDAIGPLLKFVETLDAIDQVKHVGELISTFQVFHARCGSFRADDLSPIQTLYRLLIDCATIKFLSDSMFNYARLSDEGSFAKVGVLDNKDAWNGIRSSALGLIFDRPTIDGFAKAINEKINRHTEIGVSPWLEKFE